MGTIWRVPETGLRTPNGRVDPGMHLIEPGSVSVSPSMSIVAISLFLYFCCNVVVLESIQELCVACVRGGLCLHFFYCVHILFFLLTV